MKYALQTVKLNTESPWFNDDIHAARKKRRQLERKWRNNGKLEVYRLEYQNQRFLLKSMIKNAKIDYYSSQINESAGDQKKLFKVIDNLLHKSKIPVLPSSDSDDSLATKFADFFHQKIENIRKTFNVTGPNVSSHCTSSNSSLPQTYTLTCFAPTDEEEIRKVVMKSPSKSCELDPPTNITDQGKYKCLSTI